jgi:hypothetical protein
MLELYKAFFDAWEALQAIPRKKGAPSLELKAAVELVDQRAAAVRAFRPPSITDTAAHDFRALQQQIAAIPPADGHV